MASTEGDGCNIKVAVRCRPLNDRERAKHVSTAIVCNQEKKHVQLNYTKKEQGKRKELCKEYSFDNVFGMYSTQVKSSLHLLSLPNLMFS